MAVYRHTDEYELYLALLWAEILGRIEVHPHEHFFKMGGTDGDAAAMLGTVREEFGAVVPPEEFGRDPTVAALAPTVRQHLQRRGPRPTPMRMPPWSDSEPPLIFLHSPAGKLLHLQYFRRSQLGRPVIGLRAPGADLEEDLVTTVDAIAERHVCDLVAAGIEEPVALAGSCVSALIALVIAQKLEAVGLKVGYLGLIEPPVADGNTEVESVEQLVDEHLRYLCAIADVEMRTVSTRACFLALQDAGQLPQSYSLDLFERKIALYVNIVRACHSYTVQGSYGGYAVLYESRDARCGDSPVGYLCDAAVADRPYERFWRQHLPPNTLVRRQRCSHLGLIYTEQTRVLLSEDVERALPLSGPQ